MGFAAVTLWSNATYSCVLRQTHGQFELLLYYDGRVTRLHTCQTEHAARTLASEWQLSLLTEKQQH